MRYDSISYENRKQRQIIRRIFTILGSKVNWLSHFLSFIIAFINSTVSIKEGTMPTYNYIAEAIFYFFELIEQLSPIAITTEEILKINIKLINMLAFNSR